MTHIKNTLLLSALFILVACGTEKAESAETTSATPSVEATTVANKDKEVSDDAFKIGDKAPDFKLQNIDGEYYSLVDIKDANGESPKGIILTFTCNTCPYAVMYEDRLIDLHNTMSPKGYPVVAIMPNNTDVKPGDNMAAMQERAKEKNFPFLYLDDSAQEIYPQYAATRTPEIFLLDNEMVLRYTGAIDDNAQDAKAVTVNYVEQAVEAIEAGQDPNPGKVKAIGCSIKVKKG